MGALYKMHAQILLKQRKKSEPIQSEKMNVILWQSFGKELTEDEENLEERERGVEREEQTGDEEEDEKVSAAELRRQGHTLNHSGTLPHLIILLMVVMVFWTQRTTSNSNIKVK